MIPEEVASYAYALSPMALCQFAKSVPIATKRQPYKFSIGLRFQIYGSCVCHFSKALSAVRLSSQGH